ncbi:helix-turn-helix transcriptional regulator [Pseudonocardia lacus]|uniref:helix-turn-helix transcriptional regulator n=1 Tax=Pseudonocardia lacus TaxID=2835865 RepID=UPI001BDD978C|nr:helix-turn-helix transcriptional regulator [Pseudonocardia lacus]
MASDLAVELRRLRTSRNLTQQAVADAVGVQRATVTQWEQGRFPPAPDRLRRLAEYFQAGDGLIALAGLSAVEPVAPPALKRITTPEPLEWRESSTSSLRRVFDVLADRLVASITREPSRSSGPERVGWPQSIGRVHRPSPWSTALAARTLLLLDRADVDYPAIAATLADRQHRAGWSNRSLDVPRPEVTAIVLATLSRIGAAGADLDAAWTWLAGIASDDPNGAADRGRPFVLSVVLENAAPLRPESPVVADLVRLLLDTRLELGGQQAWVSTPRAVEPSVVHTARAVAALRSATAFADAPEVVDAVGRAVEWLAGESKDDGVTEILRINPDDRGLDVPVDHFTAAHVLRALIGQPGVRPARLESALTTLWDSYLPAEGLWAWKHDGRLPVWMNYDAVVALRTAALAGFSVPHEPSGERHARSDAASPDR